MGRKITIPHYVNLGGLKLRSSDTLLGPNDAQIADNVIFRIWGEIQQRDGFASRLSSPTAGDKVRVIHQHVERASNAKTRLILRADTISIISGTTETPLETGLTDSDLLGASAQLFDDSIICTGEENPRAYTGIGLSTVDTQSFNPQWCVSFNNYMVYGGDKNLPQRLVFSALGDAKNVNSNEDFIDVLDAGQKLTGAFVLFNSLFVTSIDSITKIDGSDFQAESPGFDAVVRTIWKGTGSVNHQSITVAHDRAYFLGQFGIYKFDARTVQNISDEIEPFISKSLNRTKITNSVSVHSEDENAVIISVPSSNGETPDTHFIYHYEEQLQVWSKWVGFETSYWYAMEESGDYPVIWHGGFNGQVYRHGGEIDDDGVAIRYHYKGGWEHLNSPEKRFIPKHIMPIVRGVSGDTFTANVYTNYASSPTSGFPKTLILPAVGPIWGAVTWGAFIWGGPFNQYIPTVGIPATVARNYSIEFIHESLGKRFTITGWTSAVIMKGLSDGS